MKSKKADIYQKLVSDYGMSLDEAREFFTSVTIAIFSVDMRVHEEKKDFLSWTINDGEYEYILSVSRKKLNDENKSVSV